MSRALKIPVDILHQFNLKGELVSVEELKRGHINSTFIGEWKSENGSRRYIHQLINHEVFKDIPGLMKNMQLVTNCIREKLTHGLTQSTDTTLQIIPASSGELFLVDDNGEYWRTFEFIERTVSYDVCPNLFTAKEAGAILGRFQRCVADIELIEMVETIPNFLNAEYRVKNLALAIEQDVAGRLRDCGAEVDFAMQYAKSAAVLTTALKDGELPNRVSHNDVKLNNVLFSEESNLAISLVDLDTCMPGTILFDFGDLVRNTAVLCAEDEQDLSKVSVDLPTYKSICQGYLSAVDGFLTSSEWRLLGEAPRVLALVLGIRFLTDHLNGDTYFKVHQPNHNLIRARTQFAVARAFAEVSKQFVFT